MNKEPIQMTPGDDLHLTLLMAPQSLNFVTGQDREHLLAFGRAAFEAGQSSKCLHQIAEPADYQVEALMTDLRERMKYSHASHGHASRFVELKLEDAQKIESILSKAQRAAAPQAVQAAVPSDAEIDAAIQAFDWEGWVDPKKAKRAFTREALARWNAEGMPAPGILFHCERATQPAAQGMDAQALKSSFREYLTVSEHVEAGGHAMDRIATDLTNIVLAEQEVSSVLERRKLCNTSGQSGEDSAHIRTAAQAKQGGAA